MVRRYYSSMKTNDGISREKGNHDSLMQEYYEIKIRGHLDPHWSDWFSGLNLTYLEGDETLVAGLLPDQAALYGLLERIRDLNLTLISVTCRGQCGQLGDAEQ